MQYPLSTEDPAVGLPHFMVFNPTPGFNLLADEGQPSLGYRHAGWQPESLATAGDDKEPRKAARTNKPEEACYADLDPSWHDIPVQLPCAGTRIPGSGELCGFRSWHCRGKAACAKPCLIRHTGQKEGDQ
jgi:hypothetical protein